MVENMFICIALSLLLPIADSGVKVYEDLRGLPNDDGERRLTREYHLRQGALRGLTVKPSRHYDLQYVEMFLGIPYAAAPTGSLRFMPPVSAPPWSGVRMATNFGPVCPQAFPQIKKGNPPSLGRQHYLSRLKPFLANESEDCLYLNIYVPYREQKSKKFPVLVFIHGDSFEWSSGNPYDGRMLASYGNIMVITVNFRLGILGFMKPSLTEHEYGNNGLLDQLAALQWIKDNIEDLNGDPSSVTIMGHSTGAACVNFLMLSPISNGLFHRAILMSGSALSDWAMTKDPIPYTLQVAQSLGCNPSTKNMMNCLQRKPLSEIKKVQILAREFETPLGPVVAGSFVPNEPDKTMESYPNLLSKYQLLSGVTEFESYHDFGVIELDHGILENQRDDFIKKYAKIIFEGAEKEVLKAVLKEYSPSKLDPQRWNVETNRDVILNLFSDARTLSPSIKFANYQSKANRQSYFYVFGHNSISTDYASLNKSVRGEELPYVLGVPLGGTNTHFHSEYTPQEKLLSEVMMRLWTNFVKNGSPNTQSSNKYLTLDENQWNQYNIDWPEYDLAHQPYLKLDIPPSISSLYRSNYTNFWIESLPNKMKKFIIDPLFEYTLKPSTLKPKQVHKSLDPNRRQWTPPVVESPQPAHFSSSSSSSSSSSIYGRFRPYSQPGRYDTDAIYRQIQSIKTPARPVPPDILESSFHTKTTPKPQTLPAKTSSVTVALIASLTILFLAANVAVCSVFYCKRRKLRLRGQTLQRSRQSRAEVGEVDVIGQKSTKDDKTTLQTLKNSCSVIKSMSLSKIKNGSVKKRKKKDICKSPKSDDSGGFRERFQLRRHLSTSTLDANTKVRDWITNELMHRCSPGILRKSNSDLNNEKHMSVVKPFTRSEELLSDNKRKKDFNTLNDINTKTLSTSYAKGKTSEKTTSTSALGSHTSVSSNKQTLNNYKQVKKSAESIRSKGNESIQSKKVSIAIDATPAARTNSILKQEPIELSKSFDSAETTKEHSIITQLQRSKTETDFTNDTELKAKNTNHIYTNEITLSLAEDRPLIISHKHSASDPVQDVNYEKLYKEKMESGSPIIDILPPVTFRNEINMTSREESPSQPMTAEEALLTIKRRNFPKVLPDLPRSQKRLSLQPGSLQTFRACSSSSTDSQPDRPKVPPQPPPRTTTLDKRIAYQNSKPLSSFDTSNYRKIPEARVPNYENIDKLAPYNSTLYWNTSFDKKTEPKIFIPSTDRELPKVIIASSDIPSSEPKILVKPSSAQVEILSNVPRVRLPDDFHSGSIKSFSSIYSDDDDGLDEFFDDEAEDKLIKELVGGVESPTNLTEILDTKGPDTIFEKKLEIIPVKINPGHIVPKNTDDYVCISHLLLPDMGNLEKTANIKPNFGLNKLQSRTESINKPPEKAVKVKQRRSLKPSSILNINLKTKSNERKENVGSLEHSNSGSSNDTETSTGTVKMVEIKNR